MKRNTPNVELSDVLILAGGGMAITAMWFMSWQAGLLGTGLAIIVVDGVLRGMDLMGGRKRR